MLAMEKRGVSSDIHSSPDTSEGKEWFSPTVALTRFAPPKLIDSVSSDSSTIPLRFGFLIGDIGFLLAPGKHSELVADTVSYPVPNTPPWFEGLINLRGNLIPVFDLKRLFGSQAKGHERRRLLVVDKGNKTVALFIDGFPQALKVHHQPGQPPPLPPILREHVNKIYVHEHSMWLDLDFEGFFTTLGAQLGT